VLGNLPDVSDALLRPMVCILCEEPCQENEQEDPLADELNQVEAGDLLRSEEIHVCEVITEVVQIRWVIWVVHVLPEDCEIGVEARDEYAHEHPHELLDVEKVPRR